MTPAGADARRRARRRAHAPWLFWPFLAAIVIAPAALGANRPAFWSALAMALGILLGVWAIQARRNERLMPVPMRSLAPAALPLAGAILWAILLALPWTPSALHDPAWAAAARDLELDRSGAIGIAPQEAGTGIMRLLIYAAILWLAVQLGYGRVGERRVLWAVALAGGIYALYGLIVWMTGNAVLLWLPKWSYPDSLTSTFVSRNSYATYAGLGLIATLTLLARGLTRPAAAARRTALLLVLAAVILAALLLTRSRGGTAAVLVTVLCLPFLGGGLAAAGRGRLFLSASFGLVAVAVLVLGGGVLGRLAPEAVESWGGRVDIWQAATRAAVAHPLGSGLGSFPDRFSEHRDLGREQGRTSRAHNLYLGLAVELGPVAAGALVLGIGWLALRTAAAARRLRPGAPLAAAAGTLLVALHSLVDFSLEIPAVTATYLLLLGTGIAAAERARGLAQRAGPAVKTRA